MVVVAGMALLVALLVGGQAPANYDCSCFCGEPTDNAAEPAAKEDYTCDCDCEDVVANARAAATAASGFSTEAATAATNAGTAVGNAATKVGEANAAIAALTAAEHSANLDAKNTNFQNIYNDKMTQVSEERGEHFSRHKLLFQAHNTFSRR